MDSKRRVASAAELGVLPEDIRASYMTRSERTSGTSGGVLAVSYHFVRPLRRSRYPRLTALDFERFCDQLDALCAHRTIIGLKDVLGAFRGEWTLPDRAALLTFDDGYVDHFRYVFPELERRKLSGVFFLPGMALVERRLLDANKIHFLLATTSSQRLGARIEERLRNAGMSESQLSELRALHSRPYYFDDAETAYVKRALQFALEAPIRRQLLDALFAEHVTSDEAAFAEEVYLSVAEARVMAQAGHAMCAHGWEHERLSHMSDASLKHDIERSLAIPELVGSSVGRRAFCYPYGDHDARCIQALAGHEVELAFSVETGLVDLSAQALALPRVDTNEAHEYL